MKKIFKIFALIITSSFFITSVFADSNNNSIESVEYQNTNDADYSNQTNVFAELSSEYKVTIPKTIVLSGVDKKADYYVKVEGNIAGYETIYVVPDETVNLYTKNKDMQIGTITQDKTEWTYSTLNTDAVGQITAQDLTAGKWSGTFNFNIYINSVLGDVIEPIHTHEWQLISSTPATCNEESTETYQCNCGEEKVEHETKALGHKFVETQDFVNNYKQLQITKKCEICNEIETTTIERSAYLYDTWIYTPGKWTRSSNSLQATIPETGTYLLALYYEQGQGGGAEYYIYKNGVDIAGEVKVRQANTAILTVDFNENDIIKMDSWSRSGSGTYKYSLSAYKIK